jgi:pilus assembly protein Flp/PilA
MMKLIRGINKDTSGASAAEYALIVAVLGAAVVIGATTFGSGLKTAFSNSGTAVSGASTTSFPTTS